MNVPRKHRKADPLAFDLSEESRDMNLILSISTSIWRDENEDDSSKNRSTFRTTAGYGGHSHGSTHIQLRSNHLPKLYHRNLDHRRNPNPPVQSSTLTFVPSNFTSRKKSVVAERHGLDVRWRTIAVARTTTTTTIEEGVADAKRVIDEVLRSNAGDDRGAGLLAEEVSWALYADEATKKLLADAVTKLGACRGQDFGEFLRSGDAHGLWEVFYAPHIFAMTSAVGTQIRPLQYILSDSGFTSHARYFSPIGEGWLRDYVVRDGKTVEIFFDSFWADGGRDNLQPDPKGKGTIQRTLVNLAGRGAFLKELSVYPVYYADADVTVFEFTTLRTRIAARRIRTA